MMDVGVVYAWRRRGACRCRELSEPHKCTGAAGYKGEGIGRQVLHACRQSAAHSATDHPRGMVAFRVPLTESPREFLNYFFVDAVHIANRMKWFQSNKFVVI